MTDEQIAIKTYPRRTHVASDVMNVSTLSSPKKTAMRVIEKGMVDSAIKKKRRRPASKSSAAFVHKEHTSSDAFGKVKKEYIAFDNMMQKVVVVDPAPAPVATTADVFYIDPDNAGFDFFTFVTKTKAMLAAAGDTDLIVSNNNNNNNANVNIDISKVVKQEPVHVQPRIASAPPPPPPSSRADVYDDFLTCEHKKVVPFVGTTLLPGLNQLPPYIKLSSQHAEANGHRLMQHFHSRGWIRDGELLQLVIPTSTNTVSPQTPVVLGHVKTVHEGEQTAVLFVDADTRVEHCCACSWAHHVYVRMCANGHVMDTEMAMRQTRQQFAVPSSCLRLVHVQQLGVTLAQLHGEHQHQQQSSKPAKTRDEVRAAFATNNASLKLPPLDSVYVAHQQQRIAEMTAVIHGLQQRLDQML